MSNFKFSDKSKKQLETCHPELQRLFNKAIQYYSCIILEGHRNEHDQNEAYASGHSKLQYPNGKHNQVPSIAVDAAPYPVDFSDRDKLYYFAGAVTMLAVSLGIAIRWGGDWNGNGDFKDQTFDDLVHFELILPTNK